METGIANPAARQSAAGKYPLFKLTEPMPGVGPAGTLLKLDPESGVGIYITPDGDGGRFVPPPGFGGLIDLETGQVLYLNGGGACHG